MIGLACCEVQCGASASTAGGGIVDRSLIFPRTFPFRQAYRRPSCHRLSYRRLSCHRLFRPASRLASRLLPWFHPAGRRHPRSPPVLLARRRLRSEPYPAHERQPRLSFRAPPNPCRPPSPTFRPRLTAGAPPPESPRHSARSLRRLRRAHSRPASAVRRDLSPPPKPALSCCWDPQPDSPCSPCRPLARRFPFA